MIFFLEHLCVITSVIYFFLQINKPYEVNAKIVLVI